MILSIQTDSGEVHPVAFHSRTFTALELNYDTHDKELLAIFEAFCVWRHYLEGSGIPIDVVTDLSEDTTVHLPSLLPPPTVPDTSLHTNDRTTASC